MTRLRACVWAFLLAVFLAAAFPQAWQRPASPQSPERAQDQPFPPGSPFALLPGFAIERVTPADKTESYIVVTFDALGRPVVSQSSSGNGVAPRILLDNDNDGHFESEKIVSDKLNTCHGLFYASRTTLYANCRAEMPGDPPPGAQPQGGGGGGGRGNQPPPIGISGLYKLEDTNGDDVMDTIERLQRYTSGGMGDHGPHAIRRGPDGSVMLLVGNNTYVGSPPVNDDGVDKVASPNWGNVKERQFLPQVNDPRFGNSTRIGVHATVWRLMPDNRFGLFFSGMRNPYDFAYNIAGEAFTFDSDMEWDVNAPWYKEVNTIHMTPGGDSGYRNGTGKFQDEYFDVLPKLRHLRRGSPVGVEVYQSYAYPPSFFDNLFEADWSRGRLLYTALTPAGATYTGREDLAEFVHGEPMPITDLEVGPDGNVYLTTGGAAGQGRLYRVKWTGTKPAQPDVTGILAVVRQPQPLSSWGWANIERIKSTMGASFGAELEKLARSTANARDRSRAVLEMQRHGAAPSPELLRALAGDRDATVRAAAVFVAGLHTSAGAKAVAAGALKDANAFVKRRAAEALVRQGLTPGQPSFAPVADIHALLKDPDRFVRYAGRLALEHTPRNDWKTLVMNETNVVGLTEGLLALVNTAPAPADAELRPVFDKLIALMKRTTLPPEEKIRVLRTFQVAATETASGVDPEIRKQVHDALLPQFPTAPPAGTWVECTNRSATAGCAAFMLTHHMAKVLAYTGEPDVIGRILAVIPAGNVDQPGQIDYAYALRALDTGWTMPQKQQMIDWFAKSSKWRGGSTFSGHLNNIFDATIDAFDSGEKQLAYAAAPLFAPLTDLEIANAAAGRGGRGGGNNPAGAPGAAPAAAAPGTAPGPAPGAAPGAAAPGAGARGGAPAGAAAAPGVPPGGGGRGGRGGPPVPATARNVPLDLQERYDNLVFPRGGGPGSLAGRGGAPDAAAGAQAFRNTCAQCHKFGAIGQSYGPDLTRVGETMLRRDLLRSIFFPSEKVDAKYETTVIATKDNRTLRGLVVREDAQNVMLKTFEDVEPIAVAKSQIARRTTEKTSVMPADLPDRIGDSTIRDISVYLMQGK
jgi:putative heme-binding domain-containing protein